jgi:hypothetical protein
MAHGHYRTGVDRRIAQRRVRKLPNASISSSHAAPVPAPPARPAASAQPLSVAGGALGGKPHAPVASHTAGDAQSATTVHVCLQVPSDVHLNGAQSTFAPDALVAVWSPSQPATCGTQLCVFGSHMYCAAHSEVVVHASLHLEPPHT